MALPIPQKTNERNTTFKQHIIVVSWSKKCINVTKNIVLLSSEEFKDSNKAGVGLIYV